MTSFRETDVYNGVEERPFVSLVTNFTKPTADSPSLLTFGEFTTILHEFGHSLHGMLAEGSYGSLTGTNVKRDFVECPSQLMGLAPYGDGDMLRLARLCSIRPIMRVP